MIKNKTSLFLAVVVGLVAILGCRQLTQSSGNESNGSKTYTAAGKEWKSYDLDQTDLKLDLPASPEDKTPQLPASSKDIFSAMRIYALHDKDFEVSATELVPTGKRKWQIKDLADTNMTALKRQLPDLTYTLDVASDTNAKYNGSFTKNGKNFDLRGCCVYKKAGPARVWAIFTLYPKDNTDARSAAQRVIDSVVFKNSTEECK